MAPETRLGLSGYRRVFRVVDDLRNHRQQRQQTLTLPILVGFNGAPHRVQLQVKAAEEDQHGRIALVLFIEGDAVEETTPTPGQDQVTDETVRRLNEELDVTHSRLRDPNDPNAMADVFAAMRRGDILLHHPYDSFSTSVLAFVEQAADARIVVRPYGADGVRITIGARNENDALLDFAQKWSTS